MFRNIGPLELFILLLIVVVIFGVGRLEELGGAMGKAIRQFRREVSGPGDEDEQEKKDKGEPDA